jgi:small subunit ribosomal protein S7
MKRRSKKSIPEVKLFGKWDTEDVEVTDAGLERYLSIDPVLLPHTSGRHEHKRFMKSTVNITERLANNMMRKGKAGGKKIHALGVVKNALEIISLRTKANPIEVLVKAIQNTAPSEDTTRISYGGIVYHQAVDMAPQRRLDLSLRFIGDGARAAAYSNPKTLDECLADEILWASQGDTKSSAVRKRDEMERVALSSR